MNKTSMAGGLGSGVLLTWYLQAYHGIELPPGVEAAIGGALMPLVAWFGDLVSIIGAKVLAKVEGTSK